MPEIQASTLTRIFVACDAGVGSSVMTANMLGRTLKPFGVTVQACSVDELPADAELVLCHRGLAARVKLHAPGAVVIGFVRFVDDPIFEQLRDAMASGGAIPVPEVP